MQGLMAHRFWNQPHRLRRESLLNKQRNARVVHVPGYHGDPNERGQPGRFEKWVKLPNAAHRLYWRTHQ